MNATTVFPTTAHIADPDLSPTLLEEVLDSKARSWNRFYAAYGRHIFSAIHRVRKRVPGLLSTDDVAEIQANLAFHLLRDDMRKLRQFDVTRGTRLESWLSQVARNCAFDFLRQKQRQPQLGWSADIASRRDTVQDSNPDPYRIVAARQEARQVREIVADLSLRDQEFISLVYEQGLDPAETAKRLGVQVSTIYSKKHKIRARIEGILEKRLPV